MSYNKEVNEVAKCLILSKLPEVTYSGHKLRFNNHLLDFEFWVRASALDTSKLIVNQIHFLDWTPVVHVQGQKIRVFSAREIIARGKRQHDGRMIMPITEADKPTDDLRFSLLTAYYDGIRYNWIYKRLAEQAEQEERTRQATDRFIAMLGHPSMGLVS